MKVVLLERVDNLGAIGDVVTVKVEELDLELSPLLARRERERERDRDRPARNDDAVVAAVEASGSET